MRDFAALISQLDQSTKTSDKVNRLTEYFKKSNHRDVLWVIALWSHRRPKRMVTTSKLREWAAELGGISLWLFEESYHVVGDLAETIALVTSNTSSNTEHKDKLERLHQVIEHLIALQSEEEMVKKNAITQQWKSLSYYESFAFTKLLTGGFRIGVSQQLMTRALEQAFGIPTEELAFRLMGDWNPLEISLHKLLFETNDRAKKVHPYPFYLAYPVEGSLERLEDPALWAIEHKWDGIRAQLIKRGEAFAIWSRGEELITAQFPELEVIKNHLHCDAVLDGEIIAIKDGQPDHFGQLQKRIGRKKPSIALQNQIPVIFRAYDLLEINGQDIRSKTYKERRELLDQFSFLHPLELSEYQVLNTWEAVENERSRSTETKSEGLMIKRLDSSYQVGRKKGGWYKYKNEPFTIDAVLTYVMRGHGRRSTLYTDFTFGLWSKDPAEQDAQLVTFAKAYSGLTDQEFREINKWIKANSLEKYGPVRAVTPELVFEIAFEAVAPSSRHKSGYATRFPRILRWRKDKKKEEANLLSDLDDLIQVR